MPLAGSNATACILGELNGALGALLVSIRRFCIVAVLYKLMHCSITFSSTKRFLRFSVSDIASSSFEWIRYLRQTFIHTYGYIYVLCNG